MKGRLLPYETIVKSHEGNPEAIEAVLSHYAGYIKYVSMMNGRVNADVKEHVKQKLIESLIKFQFDVNIYILLLKTVPFISSNFSYK